MGNLHSAQQRLKHSKTRDDSVYKGPPMSENKTKSDTPTTVELPPSPGSSLYSSVFCQSNKLNYDKTTESYIINGRKYQNYNKKYILPFDEIEQDRLTQVHFLYKHLFNSNFSAPVKDLLSIKPKRNSGSGRNQWDEGFDPPRVLDIACGNGAWVLEMATEFPNSQFYGIDIVASYPTTVKPANTFFSQCDILHPNGLPFPNEYFDYIHVRQVYTCFSENDWETLVKEITRLLKPGGYVEFREIDPMMKNMGPVNTNFFKNFPRAMKEKQDVNVLWARYMYDIVNDIGDLSEIHRSVKQSRFDVPGPIGNLVQTSLRSALDSYRLFFQKCNNIPGANYDKVIDDIINEAVQYDSYFEYHCCWGRKTLLTNNEEIMDSSRHSFTLHQHYSLLQPKNENLFIPENEDATASTNNIFQFVTDEQKPINYLQDLGSESVHDIDQFAEGYED